MGGAQKLHMIGPVHVPNSQESLMSVCLPLPGGFNIQTGLLVVFLSLGQRCHICHVCPILYVTTVLISKTDYVFPSRNEQKICPCL